MPNFSPRMSKTRPVTLWASALHSHVAIRAIHRGDIDSRISSVISPPINGSVSRERALGARQLTVTPYLTSSWAAMTVNPAMPALAAP